MQRWYVMRFTVLATENKYTTGRPHTLTIHGKLGDIVYLAYPPNQQAVTGSVPEIKPRKATVSAIDLSVGQTGELVIRFRRSL